MLRTKTQRCSVAAILTRESVSRFGSGPSGSEAGSKKNPAISVLPPMNAEASAVVAKCSLVKDDDKER